MIQRDDREVRLAQQITGADALVKLMAEPAVAEFFTAEEAALVSKIALAANDADLLARGRDLQTLRALRSFLDAKVNSAHMATGELERMTRNKG